MSVPAQHALKTGTTTIPRPDGAKLSNDAVEQIKARLPIEDIIGETVTLEPASSGNFVGLCPFNVEKTPSFYVYADEGRYFCFSCKAKGDIFDFVQQTQNLELASR